MDLDSRSLFDLTSCFFAPLLLERPPWEALGLLEAYFSSVNTYEIFSTVPEGAYLINQEKIAIGKNCKIYPGAVIEGPCIIKDNVEIGPNAFIRPFCLIESFVKIGHSTEVKESLFLKRAKAPHLNYVGNSIIGNDVNLGAGVICANYKLNKTPVLIKLKDKNVATGFKKLGAIIGDRSFIGCNSVLSPGTVLKKEFTTLPCSNLYGVHL